MTWFEIFLMIYNFVVNTLRGIFKPQPDTRYKFNLVEDLVVNEFSYKLSPLFLNSDYFLEIEVGDKKLNLLAFSKTSNIAAICGLPIIALGETKINVIDTFSDELISSFTYSKGEFIDYSDIYKKCDLFHSD